jgi:hypothetical protein
MKRVLQTSRNSPRVPYPSGDELEHEHNQSEDKVDRCFHDEFPPSFSRVNLENSRYLSVMDVLSVG